MKLCSCRHEVVLVLLSLCLLSCSVRGQDAPSINEDDRLVKEAVRPPFDPTLVTVTEGALRGFREEAHNGKEFYSFRGVPFAQPPVGELRFQPPANPTSWEGVRSGEADPPSCPQMSEETIFAAAPFQLVGQEDCLYLNVFSPMPELELGDPLLPVMVFIHGGAYFFGAASQYQPYALMTQDIVLVVIQYRLGTLGFLSTEDETAPGNMGILDQTMALKWIQNNAPTFRGNPLQITIFGESAGSSSVHLQILSHTSLGYFHRAIMQSGTALSSWAMATYHRDVAYFIAKMAGCDRFADEAMTANCTKDDENSGAYESCLVNQLSSETVVQCLREVPLDLITQSCTWFFQFNIFPIMMGPRVDKNLLMQEPALLLKEHRFKKIDILMGVTKDEGALSTIPVFSNEALRSAMRHKFHDLAPIALDFSEGDIAPLNMTISIFDKYAKSSDFNRDTADSLTAMFGDRLFWYPTDTAASFHASDHVAKKKNKKTYVYEFAYRGQKSLNDIHNVDIGQDWVSHGDEMQYLFGAMEEKEFALKNPLETEEDKKMSEIMVKIWTNFAATGNPTPEGSPVEWAPFNPDSPRVLIINSELKMEEEDRKAELRAFWRSLPLKVNLLMFPESVVNLHKEPVAPPAGTEAAPGEDASPTSPEGVPPAELSTEETKEGVHEETPSLEKPETKKEEL